MSATEPEGWVEVWVNMARTVSKPSAAIVKNASQRDYYSDGARLYLQVGATGAKSWAFRYKVGGKLYEMGLGALHTVLSRSSYSTW